MIRKQRGAFASGYLLILCAAILWGLIGMISKGIFAEGISALEVAFWRALLGGGLFVAHAAAQRRLVLSRRLDALPLAGFAVVGVSLFYASLILAIDTGGISLAFILLYTAPLFVIVAAWLVLGERLTTHKLVLAPLALVGITLVSIGGGLGIVANATSIFWGLVAALTYASYYIFGKLFLERYRPVTIYAWVLPIGAACLFPFVSFAPKSAAAWGLLALLAIFSTYLAYLVYYTGLARVEASRAVLVATAEPVVAVALAALLFGERFGALGMAGAGLILATAVLASLPSWRRQTEPQFESRQDRFLESAGSDTQSLDPPGRP
ncbi:MAG: DMT family transporter [Trueperaceae bacterium]